MFARFLATDDQARLADELRPSFMSMDAAERPVAAILVASLMDDVSPAQREKLRGALEQAGIVELGHRGTRRLSPWRRALACEMRGKIVDNLQMHWRMLGRRRFGAAGIFAMPYMIFFEALEPLVEVLGFAIVITLAIDPAARESSKARLTWLRH